MSQKSDTQVETSPPLRRSMRLRKITTPPPASIVTRKQPVGKKKLPIVNEDAVENSKNEHSKSPTSTLTSENCSGPTELEEKGASENHNVEGDSQEYEEEENTGDLTIVIHKNSHVDSNADDIAEEKHVDNKNGPSEPDGSNTDLNSQKLKEVEDLKKKLADVVCHTDKTQASSDIKNDTDIKHVNGCHFKKSIINRLNIDSSKEEETGIPAKVLENDSPATLPVANDSESKEKTDTNEQSVAIGDAISDKIDELLLDSDNYSYASSESDENSLIYMMAEEGEEDTPSEGSNDIIEVGEEINTTESELSSDESYDRDSFIDDEKYQLLSGEEYDLSFEDTQDTRRKRRIVKLSSGSDDSIIRIKKPEKKVVKKRKKSRIIRFQDSSDEEDSVIQFEVQKKSNANILDGRENQDAIEVQNEDPETCIQNDKPVCENESIVKEENTNDHETHTQSNHVSPDPSNAVRTDLGNTKDDVVAERTEIQNEDKDTEISSMETPNQVVSSEPSIEENSVMTDLRNSDDNVGVGHTEVLYEDKDAEASNTETPNQALTSRPTLEENSVKTDLENIEGMEGAVHAEIQDEDKDTEASNAETPNQVVISTPTIEVNLVKTDLGSTEDSPEAEHIEIQDEDTKASNVETSKVITSIPTIEENLVKTDLGNTEDIVEAEHMEIQDEDKDTKASNAETSNQVVTSTPTIEENSAVTDLGNTEDSVGAEHTEVQDEDESKSSNKETVDQVVTSVPTVRENCNKKIIILENIRILNVFNKGSGDSIPGGTNSKSHEVKDTSDLSVGASSDCSNLNLDNEQSEAKAIHDHAQLNSQMNDIPPEDNKTNDAPSIDGATQKLPDKVRKHKKKKKKQRALVGLLIDKATTSPENGCHTTEIKHSHFKSDKQKDCSYDNGKKRKRSDSDLSTSDVVVKRKKKNKHKHSNHESTGIDQRINILDEAVSLSKKNSCLFRAFSDEDWNSGNVKSFNKVKLPQISKASNTVHNNSIKKINARNFRDSMLYDNKRVKRMETQQLLRKKIY